MIDSDALVMGEIADHTGITITIEACVRGGRSKALIDSDAPVVDEVTDREIIESVCENKRQTDRKRIATMNKRRREIKQTETEMPTSADLMRSRHMIRDFITA